MMNRKLFKNFLIILEVFYGLSEKLCGNLKKLYKDFGIIFEEFKKNYEVVLSESAKKLRGSLFLTKWRGNCKIINFKEF